MVIDDERNMCEALRILLEGRGYEVTTCGNGRQALLRIADGEAVDMVITDLRMPDCDGMKVLRELRDTNPSVPVILITAYGTIESAVEAMKIGATDFITKPFEKEELCSIVEKSLERDYGTERLGEGIISESAAMKEVLRTAAQVADAPTPILITGESGTGKGMLAEAIHKLAKEPGRPFVPISCPAIPDTLLESELFGYRKGAFTGADTDFRGRVQTSDGGTLFMDEIAEVPLGLQAKLLRLLEEKQFQPLGSTHTVSVSNRVICATNRDLPRLVKEGNFREDLFYRINTIRIEVPPLRDRREDILPMAEYFLSRSAGELDKAVNAFDEEVKEALRCYNWPGNVRELRNAVERAVVLSTTPRLQIADLPVEVRAARNSEDNRKARLEVGTNKLANAERDILYQAIKRHGGNVSAAAKELGVSRGTLRYRMKKHGVTGG